jgi:hypothetical protein
MIFDDLRDRQKRGGDYAHKCSSAWWPSSKDLCLTIRHTPKDSLRGLSPRASGITSNGPSTIGLSRRF